MRLTRLLRAAGAVLILALCAAAWVGAAADAPVADAAQARDAEAVKRLLKQAEALEQHARSLQAGQHDDARRAQAWADAALALKDIGEVDRASACQCPRRSPAFAAPARRPSTISASRTR